MRRSRYEPSGETAAGAVLLGLSAIGVSWLEVTRSDPFWGLGILATLCCGVVAVPLLVFAAARARSRLGPPQHLLAATALAVLLGAAVGASLGGLALHREAAREAAYQRSEARARAQLDAAGAPLRAAVTACADAALQRDAAEPVRGALYRAADAFVTSVLTCVQARPEASTLGFDCAPRADDTCSMPVRRYDGAPETYSFGPTRERDVFLARRDVNDPTFQARFGDRCTSGEVDPYAPGFREGDCALRTPQR
jgi:hypothetical protein